MRDLPFLEGLIRDVPDFPKPGIVFKDITPLLGHPEGLPTACALLARPYLGRGITHVAGMESRGFIFGTPVAALLGAGFVPIRKPGKLPWRTRREEYSLEYGTDALEVHEDAVRAGDRVLIVDDLLATGGTAAAAIRLVQSLGAEVVGVAFVVELGFLSGRARLDQVPATSLLVY